MAMAIAISMAIAIAMAIAMAMAMAVAIAMAMAKAAGLRPAARNWPTLSIFGRARHQKINFLIKVSFSIKQIHFLLFVEPETCNFDVFL